MAIREIPEQTNFISIHRTLLPTESLQSTYFRYAIMNTRRNIKNRTPRNEHNISQDRHLDIVENEILNETAAEKSNKA